METKGYKEAFEAVANGKVYFTIATLPVLSYYKRKYHMNNLQITGYTKMKYKLCMAVRKDDEILVNILNKMLDTIPKKTKNIIYDKWAKKEILKEIDYSLIYKISFVVFALIILFIVRNIYLKKHNKELFEQINEKNKIEEKLRELNKTLDLRIKWAIKNIQKQNDKLQESIENFQNILDTTMEMIILFDKDGKIVEINQSGVNIMGFKNKSEIISTNIESYILKKI